MQSWEALTCEYKYSRSVFTSTGAEYGRERSSCTGERTFDREMFAVSRQMSEGC